VAGDNARLTQIDSSLTQLNESSEISVFYELTILNTIYKPSTIMVM